ncbi:MAG: hypothetical protein KQ78_02009 [Candidatus Izimaplasma bacterium HR2]|nr:MAG: hypothetical protein KQ78_02009 [Candidatus Izimaplasma bacterium HR2]
MKINYAEKFKELVENESYKLLSEYIHSKNKVRLKCDKGHEYEVKPNDFKSGYRCPKCSGNCSIQAKEQFLELLYKEGCELIGEYIDTQIKVKIRCNKGHEYRVIPYSFKRGNRCPVCSGYCPIQAKKELIELLKKEGYELLGEYKNSHTKIKLKCDNNHIYRITPINFKNGIRCPVCSGNCPIQAKKELIELLKKEGYELLSKYIDTKTKIKIKCNKGHEYKVRPNHFKNGRRCPVCVGTCPIQAKEQFIELLNKEGYELLSEYKDTQIKVELRCPENHIWNVKPSIFKSNYARCPHCFGSTGQRKLQKMLKKHIQDNVIYNDREVLGGLELDIYYPELSIAIEYQGNYWHNRPETKERDERKKRLCKEKCIKLIEVWDDDFLKNPDIILKETVYKIQELHFS